MSERLTVCGGEGRHTVPGDTRRHRVDWSDAMMYLAAVQSIEIADIDIIYEVEQLQQGALK